MTKRMLLVLAVVTSCSTTSFAQKWGSIKGQFIFDGKAPAASKIAVTKDVAVCGVNPLFDEELVVNPENNGIQNVVVGVYLKRGKTVDVHPSYNEAQAAEVKFDNLACRFEPHILALRTSQTLLITNSDAAAHNTKIETIKPQNDPINPILPANKSIKHKFSVAESLPVTVRCSIHPWMTARIVVKDHPYVAITDKDGKFEIKNVPAGKHTFQVWHEKVGYVKHGKWKRGRVDWTVDAGNEAKDVGTFKVNYKRNNSAMKPHAVMKMMNRISLCLIPAFSALSMCGCGSNLPPEGKADPNVVQEIRTALASVSTDDGSASVEVAGPTGYATLRGKFTLVGDIPAKSTVSVTKDQAICAPNGGAIFADDIVVDPASKGIKNVLIYADIKNSEWIHESAKTAEAEEVLFDQKECVFLTRVVAMQTSQKMKVLNSDGVGHNLNVKNFNKTIDSGNFLYFEPEKADKDPVSMRCSIHLG